jgi:hypothetical protein
MHGVRCICHCLAFQQTLVDMVMMTIDSAYAWPPSGC